MEKVGNFMGNAALHSGAAAIILYMLNMAIWSALTAMLGGGLAMIGLGLIVWALYPVRAQEQSEISEEPKQLQGPEAVPA